MHARGSRCSGYTSIQAPGIEHVDSCVMVHLAFMPSIMLMTITQIRAFSHCVDVLVESSQQRIKIGLSAVVQRRCLTIFSSKALTLRWV